MSSSYEIEDYDLDFYERVDDSIREESAAALEHFRILENALKATLQGSLNLKTRYDISQKIIPEHEFIHESEVRAVNRSAAFTMEQIEYFKKTMLSLQGLLLDRGDILLDRGDIILGR